ncbi:ROK family transcriptional regulator [Kutzneria viridogrisea]|uniref:NBD/HSP70 family sugar kinase n=1 Tax=Kutzneria viridogrisea TaxID=47990 RepID=A0ABR6BDL3_9PSEU|nr:putative NBD/HSP70 family sugar kinase [Kutzneria viridogrisea]
MQSTGVNLDRLRGHNDALVLDLVRTQEGLSRVDLAARTGLTAQAVSKIVARLIEHGLLAESGQAAPTVGKPRTLLRVVADARWSVGVHLDRDELRVVLADLTGTVVRERRVPGPVADVAWIAAPVAELLAGVDPAKVIGIGVGCPGPLDHRTGVVHAATRLPGWHGVPLREQLAQVTGLPVIVDKDTNAAVLAERWWQRERFTHAALVYVGTGIGAGLVLDGQVHRGARTNAGEFGHTTVQADGPLCPCGRRGCVEVLCGPAAVVGAGPDVLARFAALDPADQRIRRASRLLGTAVLDLVNLLDLDHVVLGGRAAAPYLAEVERAVRDAGVSVALSELGPGSVAAGAATLPLAAYHPASAVPSAPHR